MDFSSEFVALRDRIEQNLDPLFTTRQNAEVEGRTAALMSKFTSGEERKVLGVISTGNVAYAHEYRLLFAQPRLDEQSLASWWTYALSLERALVEPSEAHSFTLISLVLVCADVDKAMQKKIRKLSSERQYAGGRNGWSSMRIAVADIAARKVYTNLSGEPFKGILKPLL